MYASVIMNLTATYVATYMCTYIDLRNSWRYSGWIKPRHTFGLALSLKINKYVIQVTLIIKIAK